MNGPNNVKMEQENAKENAKKKEKEIIFKDVIQTKFFIFPQFVDKTFEKEYNMLRLFSLKDFITIHVALTLSIILIQMITLFFKLTKINVVGAPEIFILIFLLINFFVHTILIIKINFFATKFAYAQYLFVGTILINQVSQFIVLFLQTGLIYDNSLKQSSFNMYYNKFYVFMHFFIDALLILCLPTLHFVVACLFLILYVLSNVTLIFLFNFARVDHEEDFYYMFMLIVVLVMFLGLRYWMERRNRLLLYMIKNIIPNSYKDFFEEHRKLLNGPKTNCENETDSFTVDIPKQDRENNIKRASFSDVFPDDNLTYEKNRNDIHSRSMLNDFSIDACYKDFFAVFFFLTQLLVDCKNKEIGIKTKEFISGKYNYNEDTKKDLMNLDILTVAYETKVLKNIKTVTSNELGTDWDYSFIDSEYGNSTLVVLEVGYFLISPYIEPIESKKKKLQLFLLLINSMYFPNPYHNANHGATVCHLSKCLAHITEFDKFLNNTYMICYLVAAVAHDVGHPGRTNTYLTETDHVLSIRYNDMSILENYHCSVTFAVLKLIGYDFLINEQDTKMTSKNNYSSIRKFIIELIIATDMKLHFEYVNIFKKRKKSCNFDLSDRDAINMGTINIKLADIGHTCLKWKDHAKWTMLVSEEFYAQKLMEEAYQKEKNKIETNNKDSDIGMKKKSNGFFDDIIDLNHNSIYMNYIDSVNNVKDHIYANIKLNFIHSHDFVKNIPSTQVYFFEIIVLPLIQELQAMEKSNKDITEKVLHNLHSNLKTWKIIEKNINLFYNTEKLYCTEYYKKLKKNSQLHDTDLMDINEEHIKHFSKDLSFGLETDRGSPNEETALSNRQNETKKEKEHKKQKEETNFNKKENKESKKRKSKNKNAKT